MESEVPTTTSSDSGPSAAAIIKFVFAVVLLGLFAIFAAQNAASVDLEFLVWDFKMRRIILMAICAGIGIGVWELASFAWRRHSKD